MLRLSTLGQVDLRSAAGDRVQSVLNQPKRFAILAYLCLARADVRRDSILQVFWPNAPQQKAAHALSQAINYLRRSLGPHVINGGAREGYCVRLDVVRCDAVEFLTACEHGDYQAALELYKGDFLAGFSLEESRDFDEWMDTRRRQLGSTAAQAALQLAETELPNDPIGAAAWARRAAELDYFSEPTVRRAIDLLSMAGDRTGAFRIYQSLRNRLAKEFDDRPSAKTVASVERLRADCDDGGLPPERFRSEGAEASRPPAQDPELNKTAGWQVECSEALQYSSTSSTTNASRSPKPTAATTDRVRVLPHRFRRLGSKPVMIAIATVLLSMLAVTRGRVPPPTPQVPQIFVEEVRDYSPGNVQKAVSSAITIEAIGQLAEAGALEVLGPETIVVPRSDEAALIVRAGLLRSQGGFRITALLVDARSGATIVRDTASYSASDEADAVGELASWLAAFVRRQAGAWVAEGEMRTPGVNERALNLVQSAVTDRQRADSLVRIGSTEAAVGIYDIVDSLLAQAEVKAPAWTEAIIQRAETSLSQMWLALLSTAPDTTSARLAIAEGLGHTARAVAIDDEDPVVLEMDAMLRYWRWEILPRDSAAETLELEIESDFRRVLERDPTRVRAWTYLSALLQSRGEFAEARWAAERAYLADIYLEGTGNIAARLFQTGLETGDLPAARRWCDLLGQLYPEKPVQIDCELTLNAWQPDLGPNAVDRAWALIGEAGPEAGSSPAWGSRLNILMSVILARANLPDSASAVLARATPVKSDSELSPLVAWAHLHLGALDSARSLLNRYVSENPRARAGVFLSRRFRDLQVQNGPP